MKKKATHQYVICVRAPGADDLEVRKVYQVLDDQAAEARGHLRLVDESGEDFLYPKDWFLPVEVTEEDGRALRAASPVLAKAR